MLRKTIGEACDTIFYQGLGGSQVQVTKYCGDRMVKASTGEFMWSDGRINLNPLKKNLRPLNVIYKPFIGPEIADVNLNPFDSVLSHFDPLKLVASYINFGRALYYGYHFSRIHTHHLGKISIGQETDISSHRNKHDAWLEQKDRSSHLILWGVSRGTATTFCAMAKDNEKYKDVKLVILEGAIDSVENILQNRRFGSVQKRGLNLFTAYRSDGISPLSCVNEFPADIPVVFITSEIDKVVPCTNTQKIANALAERGKNDVFLLKLKKSSHPNYMFDDFEDRDNYETFIHAVYKRYNLKHDPILADKGEAILKDALLFEARKMMIGLKS